jgi:arabinose-5-phosphate isomerase
MLTKHDSIAGLSANDIMTRNPQTIQTTTMVVDALNIMEDNKITQLVVLDCDDYVGILHLHDILKEGIA